jgi:hypothetical protein
MCDVPTIAGLEELWERTLGDDRICVAVLDGPVDRSHPSFAGANLSSLEGIWSPEEDYAGPRATHGTRVASIIFGQHPGPVPGVAPGCRGLLVPAFSDRRTKTSQLDLARGIEAAVESGAQVINVSGGQLSLSGEAEDFLARAVRLCRQRNVLLVAAAGNDGCLCHHVPAALFSALAVGAHDDAGRPMESSNFGERYRDQGILAPGENILGAVPGGGTVRGSGTSLATPIVAGVAALLLSLQLREGRDPDPLEVRAVLLESADLCELEDPDGCLRFLTGKLNVERAVRNLTTNLSEVVNPSDVSCGCRGTPEASGSLEASEGPPPAETSAAPPPPAAPAAPALEVVTSSEISPSEDAPRQGWAPLVYVLGTLGYDFGTEARRDSFKQLMPAVDVDGTMVPANPYDARQMVDHLREYPSEAKSLIWTLNLELTPIYAIEAQGPFAGTVYELLTRLLAGEVAAEDSPDYIERVSIPGRLAGRTVKLFSGQVVPVVEVEQRRGLYGWEVNALISAAIEAARAQPTEQTEEDLRRVLREFLSRIYYDLRNLGTTSADRALNFAATNAFQAAQTFASALGAGMTLDTITVEKSPFCRMDSDCWDVKLRFFDPDNTRRARKVFRFTLDVSDIMPVTLGDVRTWSEAH